MLSRDITYIILIYIDLMMLKNGKQQVLENTLTRTQSALLSGRKKQEIYYLSLILILKLRISHLGEKLKLRHINNLGRHA